MNHIFLHHRLGHRLSHSRPDLQLYTYLWKARLISDTVYSHIEGNSDDGSRPIAANHSMPVSPNEHSVAVAETITHRHCEGCGDSTRSLFWERNAGYLYMTDNDLDLSDGLKTNLVDKGHPEDNAGKVVIENSEIPVEDLENSASKVVIDNSKTLDDHLENTAREIVINNSETIDDILPVQVQERVEQVEAKFLQMAKPVAPGNLNSNIDKGQRPLRSLLGPFQLQSQPTQSSEHSITARLSACGFLLQYLVNSILNSLDQNFLGETELEPGKKRVR